MLFISTFSQDCLSLPTSSHSSKLFFQPWERLILPNLYSIANQWFLDDNSATCCVQLGWGLVKGLAYLKKDRGNPRVLKVYPYPHPFKTPTVKTLQGLKELNMSWVAVDARRFTVSMVQGFRGGHSSPSETVMTLTQERTIFLFTLLFLILVLFSSHRLFLNWTNLCLCYYADSHCTIVTHPRILILGPGGCTMTHGLIPWLTLLAYICYRLCVLNYKYPVVAVVAPQSCLHLYLAIHCFLSSSV